MNAMTGATRLREEAVRAQVERIAASPGFAKSARLCHFLRFVVEETLAGRGDRLKEYVVGTTVYGRGQSYDPRTDATVRVEAAKLRQRLAAYFEQEGRNDPLRITIPKGSYQPLIEERPPDPPAQLAGIRPRRRWLAAGGAAAGVTVLV